ncbi:MULTISPECIES: hypothetical protein [unclassified Embleya]|uniref:hypothetical protein n=1 Tax=unclassified Embleya TaxID=2699296 RepID=UPI0036A2A0EE
MPAAYTPAVTTTPTTIKAARALDTSVPTSARSAARASSSTTSPCMQARSVRGTWVGAMVRYISGQG